MKISKLVATIVFISTVSWGLMGCNKDKDIDKELSNPTIVSVSPVDHANNIERNVIISCTFSKAMNPSTISASSFILTQGTTVIPGSVYYSGTTAYFVANNSLPANTLYVVAVTTGVKDLAGNSISSNKVWSFTTGSTSKIASVNLGSGANYIILAKSAINNSSTSDITGNLGISPAATSYITGFSLTNATGYATSAQVTGQVFAADMAAPTPINMTVAIGDMETAYRDAAGRLSPDFSELYTGNLGGQTLTPGVYKWTNSVTIPSDVTLSGGSNDIWIFQISGDLTIAAAKKVLLSGDAQAKNIFWQVAGQATIGSNAHFEGNILSMTAITLQTDASLKGRLLAQTAVVLDANVLVKP